MKNHEAPPKILATYNESVEFIPKDDNNKPTNRLNTAAHADDKQQATVIGDGIYSTTQTSEKRNKSSSTSNYTRKKVMTHSHRLMGDLNRPHIILAVPHGCCVDFNGKKGACDRLALPAVEAIVRWLRELQYAGKITVVVPKITRSTVDLNRAVGTHHAFRRRLRGAIHGTSPLVLEIHSFHPGRGRIGTQAGTHADLCLLDYCQDLNSSTLTMKLYHFLQKHALEKDRSMPVLCSRLGDIRKEMVQSQIPYLSLEFNRNLSQDRLSRLTFWIARYLMQV